MNKIESLRQHILRLHPGALTNLDPPLQEGGVWSLDVDLADKQLAIEWSQNTGFGISNKSFETFGETADEHITSVNEVRKRVEQLLTTEDRTAPPLPVLLSRLRERRGLTQQDLARKLGVRQATISGMERRDDVQLSTLRKIVEALGGILEVCGLFPDARYRIAVATADASFSPPSTSWEHCSGIRVGTVHDDAFESLRQAGTLPHATQIAMTISKRHAVIEMP
jgi:DNA-binding XRE family transcriptional regulator